MNYSISIAFFVRAMGIVYTIAFISLWVQFNGLFSSSGIYPISENLANIQNHVDNHEDIQSTFLIAPSLFWMSATDSTLTFAFIIGCICSLLLTFGFFPLWSSLGCWIIYLSFCSAVPVFLNFQWDTLLLEAGFLCIFFCNKGLIYRNTSPSPIIRWLLYFLLFRLMFQSFLLKYLSFDVDGCNTWRDLSALNYHFFTQPIPHHLSWYFHQLPNWILAAGVLVMLLIQGLFPFLIFANRWCKYCAFLGFSGLMTLILLSGNYGFFNLLAIVICIPLLDNKIFNNRFLSFLSNKEVDNTAKVNSRVKTTLHAGLACLVLTISFYDFANILGSAISKPKILTSLSTWRSINSYGLFRVMTKERPEIIIEGSQNMKDWDRYHFKHKVSAKNEMASFIIPHMPRLDWQMWFAALQFQGTGQLPEWFIRFLKQLTMNNQNVLALLHSTPKNDVQYLKIRLELFNFSQPIDKEYFGHWWQSKPLEQYTIVIPTDKLLVL